MDCNNYGSFSSFDWVIVIRGLELMMVIVKKKVVHFFGILLMLMVVGCSPEPAEFKEITNARIVGTNGKMTRVKADALFYNPNKNSGRVKEVDINVSYKGQELAQVSEVETVSVPAEEDFIIPLDVDLDLQKIQDNWLSNLVNIIQDQSVELHFKGSIKVKFHGIGYKIPVDYTERIKL